MSPSWRERPLGISNNPIISPCGTPLGNEKFTSEDYFVSYFKDIMETYKYHPEQFPPSYLPKLDIGRTQDGWDKVIRLDNLTWQEVIVNFAPDPTALAVKYANEEELSPFEQDRIWAEGTMATVRLLVQHVPLTDPILVKLAQRWDFSLTFDLRTGNMQDGRELTLKNQADQANFAECAVCRTKLLKTSLKTCSNCWGHLRSARGSNSDWQYYDAPCYTEGITKKAVVYICKTCWAECDECNTLFCTRILRGCDCGHSVCPDCERIDEYKGDAYCRSCYSDIQYNREPHR
jgi:hypothetical protein